MKYKKQVNIYIYIYFLDPELYNNINNKLNGIQLK